MSVALDEWPLREPFVLAGAQFTSIVTVTVELCDGAARGWGEAAGVDYLGETPEGLRDQLESCRRVIEGGGHGDAVEPEALDAVLPAGGARNALDCALWDLRLKRAGRSIWSWLGLEPHPLVTAFTLSLDAPAAMAAAARRAAPYPVLKLKLDAEEPAARIAAVRAARADAELLVDANGSWSAELLAELGPALVEHHVALVEQPLPLGGDAALARSRPPLPLCADESCQSTADLEEMATRYQAVNVKLDKCGGLTEALHMVERCRALGLEVLVGNMLGSSLAMAPGFVVAQHCRWVDLDGPLLQRTDRSPPIRYAGAVMHPPARELWG